MRKLNGIFVEADDPKFLETAIDPASEVLDLNSFSVTDLLASIRERKKNFDTAPFDPAGDQIRFFPGGFTIWSGYPGAGKTTLLRQLACHLMSRGKSVFVASLEEDARDTFERISCTALATEEPTEEGLQWAVDTWADRLRLANYGRGLANHARILATIRVLAKQGVRHAIIDSLMKLDIDSNDNEAQRLFGNALEQTAAAAGVHIHLVAHPKKPAQADQDVDLNDVAGSANLGRLADNVIFVRRKKTETSDAEHSPMLVAVRKQRYFTGAVCDIEGYFNRRLRQFKPHLHDIHITQYLPPQAYAGRR